MSGPAITGAEARLAREALGLDPWGMGQLLGVSIRKVFYLEARGVPVGPTALIYDLVRQGDLPVRYVPQEDARGRIYPTTG